MKDALKMTSHNDMEESLDIHGRDRINVLFSGTSLISASPRDESVLDTKANSGQNPAKTFNGNQAFPKSPDGGCLCYVLRTGFGSSQGELMQMIE